VTRMKSDMCVGMAIDLSRLHQIMVQYGASGSYLYRTAVPDCVVCVDDSP
jgi:hypothetical protein